MSVSSASAVAGATENNQRLFLRFRKVFSENNPRDFIQFAEKLIKWLGDRKAYYEAARPEIIKLLLVAETTVRAALNVSSSELITPFNVYEHPPHPLVAPYVSMVQTVCQFEDMFEPAFKEHVKRMRANITPPVGHPSLSTMNEKHLLSFDASQPPKANVQHLSDPDIQIIAKPQQPPHPDRPPPPYSAHGEAMLPSTSQVSAPIRTRKVKKKKTLDFDALSKFDIEDALQQQQRAKSADNSSFKVHTGSPLTPVPSTIPTVSGTTPAPARDRSTEIIVEGSVRERPGEIVVASETKTTTDAVQIMPLTRTPDPFVDDAPMEVDSHLQAQVGNSSDMRRELTAPPTSVVQARLEPRQTAPTHAQTGQASSAEGANLSKFKSPSPPTASRTPMIHPREMASGFTSLAETLSMDLGNQEQHLPLQEVDQAQATMDIDSVPPTNASILTSGSKDVEMSDPPSSQRQQETLSIPASNNARAGSSMSISPRLSSGSLTQAPVEKAAPASMEKNENYSKAGCSMRVIALQKGPSKGGRIPLNFVIKKEEFLGVSIWNSGQTGREAQLRELQSSGKCISLSCYATNQLAAQHRQEGCDTIEKQLASLHSIWPSGDQVSIDIMLEGKRAVLPLSPPFQVTPDNFVDISQFTSEGANTIELSHQRDLSRYTFVLLVHDPTQAQLKQLGEQQKRDNEWAEWVKDLTKPFSVPIHTGTELMI